jgi:hypothetical protein
MAEVEAKAVKKEAAAPAAASPKAATKPSDLVSVQNFSKRSVPLAKGVIQPGKKGKATIAEVRRLHKFIKEV